MKDKFDYIIVGQGIAGSMLTHFLLEQGKKVLVLDKFNPNSASNIAAGVVNPITGRRMAKSWMIDELMPFARKTYRQLEQQLAVNFFYEQSIYKIFSSSEDIAIWKKKRDIPEYMEYLGAIIENDFPAIEAPYGIGIIQQAAWMDVPVFIKAYRGFLRKRAVLLEEELDFSLLQLNEIIRYKQFSADAILFCEGYKVCQNELFNHIPFTTAKGEQLIIRSEEIKLDDIFNKNIYIIPQGNDLYTIGSTFIWDDLTESVTNEGKSEMLAKLHKLINVPYQILEEKAGIRPTINDRRPVLGAHSVHGNVYIFNGLGTKGVSLAPYFSDYFVRHLLLGEPILPEISVNRFDVS